LTDPETEGIISNMGINLKKTIRQRKEGFALTDEMYNGKYEGWTIRDIIDSNLNYIDWMMNNRNFLLDNEAYLYFQEALGELPF
jgi:hypothetical protein